MTVHLVVPDPHAHPAHNNNRAIYLGKLIADVKPDTVIVLGDTGDFPSLSAYDKGRASFQGRLYAADVAAHGDFQDKLWSTVRKAKKKMPRRITLIGNHEQRIERALDLQPELKGTIGYEDLELDRWYDEVVPYKGSTPGVIEVDGVHYAHYFISGVMGRSVSGEHPAYSLLGKKYTSCTQGHTHVFDHCLRTGGAGQRVNGLVAGCFFDYEASWAGECNSLYWRGVVICRGVDSGGYSLQQVSMKELRKQYGNGRQD